MNTLTKYKKGIRNLFFASVDKDLEKWTYNCSPYYNNTQFEIKKAEFFSYLTLYSSGNREIISTYKWLIFPLDFKVWLYAKKLKRHFKKLDKDKENADKISMLKNGLENIEKEFIKEIRKEKLDKITKITK